MKKLKIAILGTRGIPNNYGGFEECAEKLSYIMAKLGHNVTVYNPDIHPYKESKWNGVKIKKIFSKENKLKIIGNFIFDYLSLRDAVKEKNDIILELGYSPSALFYNFVKRGDVKIVTNMDGLDWKREKWSFTARNLLRYSEKLAVKKSDAIVADNSGIAEYLKEIYDTDCSFIPYGAELFDKPDFSVIKDYDLTEHRYYLVIARIEPENNIEIILRGYVAADVKIPIVIVGPRNTSHGSYLGKKYSSNLGIRFLDGIYDKSILDNLRYHCRLYFHGHSVGGTNPSLLEAMAAGAQVVAHDNIFNRGVLGNESLFFISPDDVKNILCDLPKKDTDVIKRNMERISGIYNWDLISKKYLDLFYKING